MQLAAKNTLKRGTAIVTIATTKDTRKIKKRGLVPR